MMIPIKREGEGIDWIFVIPNQNESPKQNKQFPDWYEMTATARSPLGAADRLELIAQALSEFRGI